MGNTKFSVGQHAYYMHNGKVELGFVKTIQIDESGEFYFFKDFDGSDFFVEKKFVYETIDELLNAITDQVAKKKASEQRTSEFIAKLTEKEECAGRMGGAGSVD